MTHQLNIGDGVFPHRPGHMPGKQKYMGFRGGRGLYTAASFGNSLPLNFLNLLIKAANNSLTEGTWAQYTTARRHLEGCQKHTGRKMGFPMSSEDVYHLVGYLFEVKGVKGSTVSKVLSAIRTLHLVEGLSISLLSMPIMFLLQYIQYIHCALWQVPQCPA